MAEAVTEKGASLVWGVQIETPGSYDLHLRLRVEAGELAQVPLTVFNNGNNRGTFTFRGGDDSPRELTVDLAMMMRTNNFIRLYFAQSGIRLEEAVVSLREPLKKRFWE